MKLPKVIYVMGLPGSGKGTQAAMLAKAIGYYQFSTGDELRTIARENTPLGIQIKSSIDNGYFAPPPLVAEIVKKTIAERLSRSQGIVFDGTPRTIEETEILDEFFLQQQYGRPLIIYLEAEKEAMIERNSKRKYCVGIDHGFPLTNEASYKRCEELGGSVGMRADDDPKKFHIRYEQFIERTYPVIEKYKKENIVHTINGMDAPLAVHQNVMDIIKAYELDKNPAGN